MKKYTVNFTLRVNGEATVEANSPEDAWDKLLKKDAIDIVNLMNIDESDLEDMVAWEAK